jgi:hypothetical protein
VISHADCAHASTPGERAKCRRRHAKGEAEEPGFHPPLYSLGPPPKQASVKTIPEKERNRGKTPRDKAKQCHICGVEKIVAKGTHRLMPDLTLLVGEDCFYYLDPDEKITAMDVPKR